MKNKISIEELWEFSPPDERIFQPEQTLNLPAGARKYLEHAITPGTRLASAVRLRMHGEIKLKKWMPFTAEQVIRWDRGLIWNATVMSSFVPIIGSDRIVDGEGCMQWKLFGLFPVMTASGPDIAKSCMGRMQIESVWLPSALCLPGVTWKESDPTHLQAHFSTLGESTKLNLDIGETGQLKSASLDRWGNPDGAKFQYSSFGCIVEEERSFEGRVIPSRLRAGWKFGSDKFESEGEFFRATVDSAAYK